MKKILTGVLAFSLLSIAFTAFSQLVPIDKPIVETPTCFPACSAGETCLGGKCVSLVVSKCKFPKVWDEEQGKCVDSSDEHGCGAFQVWDEEQEKCVVQVNENHFCKHGVWDAQQGKCVDNEPEPAEPEYDEVVNVPSLENFTLEEGNMSENDIYLVFAPKGNLDFRLNVYLHNEAGRDILDGWCTGDETLCKAVGNGRACPTLSIPGPSMSETVAPISNFSNRHTGENTWCYEGGSKTLKEAKVVEKVEKIEMVEKIKKVN